MESWCGQLENCVFEKEIRPQLRTQLQTILPLPKVLIDLIIDFVPNYFPYWDAKSGVLLPFPGLPENGVEGLLMCEHCARRNGQIPTFAEKVGAMVLASLVFLLFQPAMIT